MHMTIMIAIAILFAFSFDFVHSTVRVHVLLLKNISLHVLSCDSAPTNQLNMMLIWSIWENIL